MKKIVFLFLFITVALTMGAQSYSQIEKGNDKFERAAKFSSDSIYKAVGSVSLDVNWFRGSDNLYWHLKEEGFKKYFMADAHKGKVVDLFSIDDSLSCYISDFDKKNKDLLICRMDGKDLNYSLSKREFIPIVKDTTKTKKRTSPPKREYWKNFSADSLYYMYGQADDVFLHNVASGRDIRITNDGEPYYSFTTHKSAETDTTKKSVRGHWHGNTNYAVFLRPDYRDVTDMTVVNNLSTPPVAKNYKMELANDSLVTRYELFVLNADGANIRKIDISHFKDQEVKLIRNFHKNEDYKYVYFTRKNRTNDTIQLCDLDPATGKVRTLIEEVGDPIYNDILHSVAIINGGDDIIWWSERDGKGAFYLYDIDGNLKNKIAGGNYKDKVTDSGFIAGKIFNIDTLGREIILEGYDYFDDRNPYEKYYFNAPLNGKKVVCITPSSGNHDINFSPSKEYFIDTYSAPDKFPRKELRSINGKLIKELPMPDTTALLDYGWVKPVSIELLSSDNKTKLYGVMYLPGDMREGQKYPIICNMYPGPQTDLVPRSFSLDDNDNGALAQMGFVVINIGLIGSSPYRGPEFYGTSHGNLRDYAVNDLKYCVEQLSTKYDFIDIDRVGIYGHSGGASLTVTAMLTFPDFFKVGVAASGNHDNNIYAKFWGEVYNGYGPTIDANMELAPNLEGKLLLMTGDVDDNVHPANTFKMVKAFMDANKRIDMFVIPGADHNMYGSYYNRLIRHYFLEHL